MPDNEFNSPSSTWPAPPSPTTAWWSAPSRRPPPPRGCPRPGRARPRAAVRARHHGPVQDQRLPGTVRQPRSWPSGPTPRSRAPTTRLIDEGRAEPIDGAAEAITRLRDAGVKRGPHHRVQRDHAGETAGRAGLAVHGRPGARARRRGARPSLPRPDPDRADAAGRRRRRQRRRARRHHQRRRKRTAAGCRDRRGHAHRRPRREPAPRRRSHPRRRLGDRVRRPASCTTANQEKET